MILPSASVTFQPSSFGSLPANISDSRSLSGVARVANRSRTVRCVDERDLERQLRDRGRTARPGNSVESPRTKGVSSLLNDRLGWRTYRCHSSSPAPVSASNFVIGPATKYVESRS